jgi:hypothetical protein
MGDTSPHTPLEMSQGGHAPGSVAFPPLGISFHPYPSNIPEQEPWL